MRTGLRRGAACLLPPTGGDKLRPYTGRSACFRSRGAACLLPLLLAALPIEESADPAVEAQAPPAAAWSAGTVVEPESVEEVPAALVRNDAGFVLAIAREPGGERVIGIFRLPPADQDFLDEGRPLEIEVDGGAAFAPRRLGGGLKSQSFSLWDGVGEPVIGPLRDLMEARDGLIVRYPLAGGGHKEVELSAAGAKEAIAKVLGVAAEVGDEARALAVARQEAVEGCLRAEKPKERDRCLERLATCAESATADDLRSCLATLKK